MGSLVSAISGSSKKAAKRQRRAIAEANSLLAKTRDQNIEELQPIADTGLEGLDRLAMYLGIQGTEGDEASNPLYGSLLDPFTGEDLAATPGYQFGMDQGLLAQQRQQAASGNLLSGASLKAAQRFGQDYAGTKFQEGYNRDALDKSRINDFLSSVSNVGINTTGNIANMRTNTGAAIAGNTIQRGNVEAAGIMGQANAWGNVVNDGIQAAVAGATMGMGGLGGAAGMASKGGMASGFGNAMGGSSGFSQNMLNPNFAANYRGLM